MQEEHVLFVLDIDGALTDSVQVHQEAFEAALRLFLFPNLRTDWASYQHHSDSAIFSEAWQEANFQGKPDKRLLEFYYKDKFDFCLVQRPIQEIKGALDFLSSLTDNRWSMVYATGSLRYGAMKKLNAIGINTDDALIITASEYETREEIVSQAISAAKEKFALPITTRIISIGDGLWDLKTAQALGLEFMGISKGEKAKVLTDLGALVFEDFSNQQAIYTRLKTIAE